ncbi:MAG: hypothetical protein Q9194_001539 [Teloschistes cf. exilis]
MALERTSNTKTRVKPIFNRYNNRFCDILKNLESTDGLTLRLSESGRRLVEFLRRCPVHEFCCPRAVTESTIK